VSCLENDIYTIKVGESVIECTKPGAKSIDGFLGYIMCFPYNEVCYDLPCSYGCYGVGIC
jgi:hypothetical protein